MGLSFPVLSWAEVWGQVINIVTYINYADL